MRIINLIVFLTTHMHKRMSPLGREIRNSIERLGGTMPENLSTPGRNLKELEKERKIDNKKNHD